MTPIMLIWMLAAGSFLTMAVIELSVAALQRTARIHVAFSVVALAAMGAALAELTGFTAPTPSIMASATKTAVSFNILAHLGLIVFMSQYSGCRLRWPGWLALGIFSVGGILHLTMPAGITFSRIEEIARVTLPWGESIALPVGPAHPAWPITFSAIPILLFFLGDLVVQVHRRGEIHRARRIAAAAGIVIGGVSFVLGLVARAMIARRLGAWVERALLGRLPMYDALRHLTNAFREVDSGRRFRAAMVRSPDGTQRPAYLIEELPDGRCTVLLPGVPAAFAGSLAVVDRHRVELLDVSLADFSRYLSLWGVGLGEALKPRDLPPA